MKKYQRFSAFVGTLAVSAAVCLVLIFGAATMGTESEPPRAQWELSDQTTPMPTDPEPDGTYAPEDVPSDDPTDPDASPDGPGQDDDSDPDEGPADEEEDESEGTPGLGFLNLSVPTQAGLSMGAVGLAFLALLPGRRMPDYMRH